MSKELKLYYGDLKVPTRLWGVSLNSGFQDWREGVDQAQGKAVGDAEDIEAFAVGAARELRDEFRDKALDSIWDYWTEGGFVWRARKDEYQTQTARLDWVRNTWTPGICTRAVLEDDPRTDRIFAAQVPDELKQVS